jgi:hypothetical protein
LIIQWRRNNELPTLVNGLLDIQEVNIVDSDLTKYTAQDIETQLEAQGFNRTFWQQVAETAKGPRIGDNNALGPTLSVGSGFFQFKDLKTCHDLIEKHEQNGRNGLSYEWVVVIRTDNWCLGEPFCFSDMMHEPNKETIYIPKYNDFKGFNDRLIALPREAATRFLTGPWQSLVTNTNPTWFYNNTEMTVKGALRAISPNLTTNRRTDCMCFISCRFSLMYNKQHNAW